MVEKQQTGFRFGKHPLTVVEEIGAVKHQGRTYKMLKVRTEKGQIYRSLRLYNGQGKFIKQMLVEPEIRFRIAALFELGGD